MRIIELNKSVTESNDRDADCLRAEMKKNGTLMINLMSSPGSGKTTLLSRVITDMKEELRIGVMEADIASDVDALRIEALGARAIQAHTDGMCHMDAGMTERALRAMGDQDLDLVFLENVGNLICPAEFDTGSGRNIMILSIPEGDDKPLKYPLMFETCDALLLTKTDTKEYFDFDFEACEKRVKSLNPDIRIFPVSAKTGEGMARFEDWIREEVRNWKE
uniref:hydrogenase nickel incorporation protein HypB n=1 Tax=Eubacterium cellulosolvens TaxID=29322 RepID=UPI000488044F|nr:hydrogenase nickel incorporation protein HypB [[Eubacterium] cellulosolvens]